MQGKVTKVVVTYPHASQDPATKLAVSEPELHLLPHTAKVANFHDASPPIQFRILANH